MLSIGRLEKYLLFLFSLSIFIACEEAVEWQEEEEVSSLLLSRSDLGDVENKNSPEEAIHQLKVVVFNYFTKELVSYQELLLQQEEKLIFDVKPGLYNFFFVANPSEELDRKLRKIKKEGELPLITVKQPLWGKREILERGIPMVAQYQGVEVPRGGTKEIPIPFEKLPNASIVKLQRTLAKLSIHLTGDALQDLAINGVELHQVPTETSPFAPTKPYGGELTRSYFLEAQEVGGEYLELYLPAYIQESTPLSWKSDAHIIPYIQVKLQDRTTYEIPIVANYKKEWSDVNYFEFARADKKGPQGEHPSFEIARNKHFEYNLTLERSEIKFTLEVLPWQKETYEYDEYAAPDYELPTIEWEESWELVDGNILLLPIGQESPSVKFALRGPSQSRWTATLTNGHNFKFTTPDRGVANPQKEAVVRLQAKQVDATAIHAETELYFTVNNKEIPLRIMRGGVEWKRFIGKGNRLQCKLVY